MGCPVLWDGMPPGQFRYCESKNVSGPCAARMGHRFAVKSRRKRKVGTGGRSRRRPLANAGGECHNSVCRSHASDIMAKGCFAMFPALRLRRCHLLAPLILISVVTSAPAARKHENETPGVRSCPCRAGGAARRAFSEAGFAASAQGQRRLAEWRLQTSRRLHSQGARGGCQCVVEKKTGSLRLRWFWMRPSATAPRSFRCRWRWLR